MKAKLNYTRAAKPIKGAEIAKLPRTHAEMPADDKAIKQNPQRMDILRRHALSSRNQDNP
jgi:hypothetical protein